MFGTILTKLGGMRHVWLYYTEYRHVSLDEAERTIRLRRPYPNANCMQCHSTQVTLWKSRPDHVAILDEVRSGRVSCASAGCHGRAHPNFGPQEEPAKGAPSRPAESEGVVRGPAAADAGAP
jgi:cytochrome c-type protein NapC